MEPWKMSDDLICDLKLKNIKVKMGNPWASMLKTDLASKINITNGEGCQKLILVTLKRGAKIQFRTFYAENALLLSYGSRRDGLQKQERSIKKATDCCSLIWHSCLILAGSAFSRYCRKSRYSYLVLGCGIHSREGNLAIICYSSQCI